MINHEKYYYILEKKAVIKSMFTDDLEHFHEKPAIFCLDEFQFARTIDTSENELTRDKMRVLWELFDSGTINYEPKGYSYHGKRADIAIQQIHKCVKLDVKLDHGEITGNTPAFLSIFSGYYFDAAERYGQEMDASYFLSKDFLEGIKEIFDTNNFSDHEIQSLVKSFSLIELEEWLLKGVIKQQTIKQLDLSRSLIFVLGNLDEAFYMSHELSPDMSADDFYHETLKINIADIKSALKKRFRNEQIARLGNNHLIYPCFNNEGFNELIRRQLDRIGDYMKIRFDITINFFPSVVETIYNEGVFPSQGVRPVLTTVKQLVESYMGRLVCEIVEKKLSVHTVNWEFQHQNHQISFLDESNNRIGELKIAPKLKLDELRKSDNNDVQAHIAIHESGHAIVAALSLRILPSVVVTKTVSSTCEGFCRINLPEKLVTRDLIYKQIMISLAGFVAEKLILGVDNTSTGVCSDIERATELANQAIKEYAMGSVPVRIQVPTMETNDLFFNKENFSNEAMNLIQACLEETEKMLNRNKLLLLKMAQFLTENSVLRESAIGEMIKYYTVENWPKTDGFVSKENYYRFKDIIQQQVNDMEKPQVTRKLINQVKTLI